MKTAVRYSHCGDIFSGKGIGGVADEQAGLTHSSGRGRTRKNDFSVQDLGTN